MTKTKTKTKTEKISYMPPPLNFDDSMPKDMYLVSLELQFFEG